MSRSKMKPSLVHPSNPEWKKQIKSWQLSGLSKGEYCRRRHISYHTFNYWKKRLKIFQPPSSITLIKLEESQKITSSFQQQSITSKSSIHFWVKDFCIEVENNFCPTVLGQPVQTLRRI